MTWTRREFLRTGSYVLAGGIFVPKYERWFKPIVVPKKIYELFMVESLRLIGSMDRPPEFEVTLVGMKQTLGQNSFGHMQAVTKKLTLKGYGYPKVMQTGSVVNVNIQGMIAGQIPEIPNLVTAQQISHYEHTAQDLVKYGSRQMVIVDDLIVPENLQERRILGVDVAPNRVKTRRGLLKGLTKPENT